MKNKNKTPTSKKSTELVKQILITLQLLCEGHYMKIQNYLRQQNKSKTNYNIVELVATLCSEYTVSKDTYEVVEQCFETLTEMI